jgi:Tfp pilus assembly protein FimV
MYSYRRRSRASLIPLIQLLSLVLVFALPAVWASRVYTSSPTHFSRVTVRPGDTVWTIASRRVGAGADVNEAAYQVLAANHLSGGTQLRPGQVLLVPR